MPRTPRRAAAWAAPLASIAIVSPFKRTHKLKPMVCVLWLPDYGGYLREVNLAAATFTLSQSPDTAMRLNEDLAESVGQDLIDVTGVRVHLRPFTSAH
jgi:hypothetical protein